jgi:subtilisin-like proprotein convertase family protein
MSKRRIRLATLTGCAVTLSVLAVAVPATEAAVYTPSNGATFNISSGSTGPASPGSTIIKLYGAATTISDVNVTLNGVSHTNGDDLDIEVVGPDGTAVPLMSDVCGATISGATLTLDDQASTAVPDAGPCNPGSYKPNDVNTGDVWDVTPTATTLAAFNGKKANGSWTLYVNDDTFLSGGSISGWSLTITTAADAAMAIPGPTSTVGDGVANPYPIPITVSGLTGQITDVNLVLPGLTHSGPSDLDVLLVAPSGAKALVMSDSCGTTDANNVTLTLDDQAAASMPASGGCPSGSYKPTDFGSPQDAMEGPAPTGPHPTTLSAFDVGNPNGVWDLYVRDDGNNFDTGWLLSAPALQITTTTGGFNGNSPPDTILIKKPKSSTKTSAKVTFTSTEASTFECKLDKKKWRSCSSPFKARKLKVGKHKLQVRAIDRAGLADASPAKVTWKVKKP